MYTKMELSELDKYKYMKYKNKYKNLKLQQGGKYKCYRKNCWQNLLNELKNPNNKKKYKYETFENTKFPEKMDFSNIDFEKLGIMNLSRCDLTHANLQNCNLTNVNLSNAILRNANLSGATLMKSSLRNAHCENAILVNVNIQDSNLTTVKFNNATITDSKIHSCDLKGGIFSGANLNNTTFDNCYFNFVDFNGSKINNKTTYTNNKMGKNKGDASNMLLIDAVKQAKDQDKKLLDKLKKRDDEMIQKSINNPGMYRREL